MFNFKVIKTQDQKYLETTGIKVFDASNQIVQHLNVNVDRNKVVLCKLTLKLVSLNRLITHAAIKI